MLPLRMEVSILVNIILEKYFLQERCLILLADFQSTFIYSGNHQKISISIDEKHENVSKIIDDSIFKFQYGCEGIVIDTLEPAGMFEDIEEKIRHSLVRYNNRKYLIIFRENIDKIDNVLWNVSSLRFVIDMLFVKRINSEKFEIWSYNFIGNRDKIRFELVDTWFTRNHSFLVGSNLYPDKLRNLHGRILRLSCFTYPPYTNCDRDNQLDGYYGTELSLVIMFAKLHNLTAEFVYNEIEDDLWGKLHPNWTGSGLMGNVLTDKADIAFTAFYIWEFVNNYLDMSHPYLRTGITCLVPKPKILGGWITPLFSFQYTLWIAVIGNFVFDTILIFLLLLFLQRKFKINTNSTSELVLDSFWIIMKICFGQSVESKMSSFIMIERFILAILFLAYLILNSAYFSGLSSIMTIPRYEDPIDTLSSLANSDVNILGIFEDWVLSIKDIKDENYEKIVEHFKNAPEEELRKLSEQENNAFFMERLQYSDYGINDFIKDDVIENYHIMKEEVYWEFSMFFLRKSSVLAPSFDIFILRVLESGLAAYWQAKAVHHFMDSSVQNIATRMDNSEIKQGVVKLRISHIEGSIALLFIGYLLSAATFISERFIYYKFKL